MSDRDGGSAFPRIEYQEDIESGAYRHNAMVPVDGMSLRDWFAGQALTLFAGDLIAAFKMAAEKRGIPVERQIASAAYDLADAMLKAREAK